jgi:hypothetical protein
MTTLSPPVFCDPYNEKAAFLAGEFVGLTIDPVTSNEQPDGSTECRRCDPAEAEFWSVYGCVPEGGSLCLGDFATAALAYAYAEAVSAAWGIPLHR